MTHKILCAVDDTDHSESAIAQAAELAKATGAELTLLAVNLPAGGDGRGGFIAYTWDDADAKRVLNNASALANKAGYFQPQDRNREKPRCGAFHCRLRRGQRN